MADRLIVDLNRDGTARMSVQLDGDDLADGTAPFGLTWPLDGQALDDLRDRRPDAEEWYRKALAIGREAGDAVVLASSLRALATFAEERDEPRHALALLVEGATQFEEFPHPLAGLVPEELRRLAHGLGMDVLREEWRKVTGNELPQQVREYVERGGDDG